MEEGAGEEECRAGATRQALHDDVWLHVESSIEGYASMIDRLMELVPDKALAEFVEQLNDSEDENDPSSD